MTQIEIPNIDIKEITLINANPSASGEFVAFTVYPRNKNEPVIFDSIVLDEDMFSESVSGTLYFYDPAFIVEQMAFRSYDNIQIKLQDKTGIKSLFFKIVEIASSSNAIEKKTLGPLGNTIPVAVRFASDQLVYKNFDTMLLRSFIGKISYDKNSAEKIPSLVDGLEKCENIPGEGFVQYVFNQFGYGTNTNNTQKTLKADNTFNDVWFKVNPSHYPWSKLGVPAKIGQMMNYICEYACFSKNQNAVNFFFWEDLDKFNFRCIESLLKEPIKATYTPSLNENDLNAMVELQVIAETPVTKLVNNGAFSGEFTRIKPDWSNPYRTILDTSEGLKRTRVVYDYYNSEDKNKFAKISTYPPIDENDVSIVYAPNMISDSNYGYYQEAYGQKELPWWNYWDAAYKYYSGELIGGITSEVERIEGNYWQAQFDFCELPASCLKKIYEEIKWPLTKDRLYYSYLKRSDVKWKFYRNTILGERNLPSSFFAILTDARKIYSNKFGGIYRYFFQEIEFWPKGAAPPYVNIAGALPVQAAQDHLGRDYPFTIVTAPWGLQGVAYNLNELLNGTLPSKYEKGADEEQTALIGPGLSVKVDPGGVSPDTPFSNYRMQAVGEYFVKTGDSTSIEYVGRIVKIDVVNSGMLDLIGANLNACGLVSNSQYSNMFVFDVENAVDGTCGEE